MKAYFLCLLCLLIIGIPLFSFAGQGGYHYFQNQFDPWTHRNIGIHFKVTNTECLVGVEKRSWTFESDFIETNQSSLNNCNSQEEISHNIIVKNHEDIIANYRIKMNLDSSLENSTSEINQNYWHHADLMSHGTSIIGTINIYDYILISASEKSAVTGWMGQIYNSIKEKPINQILIPGSHNSASNNLGLERSPDFNSDHISPPEIIKKLSQTQYYSIMEQLERGIRYLNIQFCFDGKHIRVCHGVYSKDETAENIFIDVRDFLSRKENNKELIIIDIQNFHNWILLPYLFKQKFRNMIQNYLGQLVAPQNHFSPTSSFQNFINSGHRVIILQDNPNHNLAWDRAQSICHNDYNFNQINDILNQFENNIKIRELACSHDKFLLSELAYKMKEINITHPNGVSLKDFLGPFKMASIKKLNEIKSEKWLKDKGNIIIEDFSSGFDLALIAKDINTNTVTVRIQNEYSDGYWGDWANETQLINSICKTNEYVGSYYQISEPNQENGDDTALNAIRMNCYKYNNGKAYYFTRMISSNEILWKNSRIGAPSGCFNGPANGFQMLIETNQIHGDDTAANSINLKCLKSNDAISQVFTSWGTRRPPALCPVGYALVGFITRVESNQKEEDDTALNGVRGYCKPFIQ
ncbi:hypothetical protein [Silvanigrella aquatica]|uniref:Phosphatidylinositol diacylglycerol-lyase n=1 Tax=Silvanigrella aquatica TaxID=1915309 RepID=A0A1L4CZD4_9BACT|nr:hypothetical protein [Silvanigrella aquatica]APJ03323.1 hypothetical protein AXG55_05155 [Silvanigrella aquatica]